MFRRVRKFNSYLTLIVSIIGIQFLLLPFYHFHPDNQHSHPGELPSHQHNAYFHSIELDSIAHLTHSHDHNSETAHHSQHSESNGEYHPKIELNKETLKSWMWQTRSGINYREKNKKEVGNPLKKYHKDVDNMCLEIIENNYYKK